MARKKLLVVDDEYHVRLFFFEELSEEGYDVVTSDGSEDILKLVDREKPHVIILDINLERKESGFDLLRAIRSRDHHLPVILCTALGDLQDDLQTIDADWFVAKSIDSTELKLSIRNLLGDAEKV
ncbi:response regulator [Desulfonatronum thioautotrophicum]|uniref:response regulator n=1 Tax=Desulfonatronum thioautotrophicum TaxID=617001 RepID=UPI0005EBE314|nr:response regulator [Desulfonatronum thioautotrophicum]